jgi:Uma2 family endonuclease
MVVKRQLTLEEFAELPDDGSKQELDRGEVKVMAPPGFRHSRTGRRVDRALSTHVEENALGEVFVETAFMLSSEPPVVRVPDVSFVLASRLPDEEFDEYLSGAPDLAVEVVSPNDRAEELRTKVRQYLDAGAVEVWVLYPKTRQIEVWGAERRDLNADDTLSSPELFPGWSFPVADLF